MRYPEIRESSEVSMEQYVSLAHSLSFLHRRPATTEVRGVGHERRNNFCGNPLCDTWADNQPTEPAPASLWWAGRGAARNKAQSFPFFPSPKYIDCTAAASLAFSALFPLPRLKIGPLLESVWFPTFTFSAIMQVI